MKSQSTNPRKSRSILSLAATALMFCAQQARADVINIYGPDAGKLMEALEAMGVLAKFDNSGGFVMQVRDLDCYVPVVPNPKAHCYAYEATESGETFDESPNSKTTYNILENYGAGYDDGSVGAMKAGLLDLSCYRLISTGETSCSGKTKL